MTESEPRRFPGGADQERAQHEAQRLHSIKEYIDYLAFIYSRDAPGQEEDIAQEARLAVTKKLRQDPDCHISHLKVKAKSGIRDYRRRGRSIDGKLNETDRQRHYDMLNLDQIVTEDGNTLVDTLNAHSLPFRITEAQALHRVALDQLKEYLSPEENQALTLRLMGLSWSEVGEILSRAEGEMAQTREKMINTAVELLSIL